MRTFGAIVLALVAVHSASPLQADGKFFVRDAVPAGEPFQRAVIAHGGGKEILIVQPQLVGEAKDFAWVLPVPAVPEMGHLATPGATDLFGSLARRTRPEEVRLALPIMGSIVIAIAIIIFLPRPRWPWRYRIAVFMLIIISVFINFLIPTTMSSRGIPSGGVDVLKSDRVGIYDVSVVRSESPTAMRDWLIQGKFLVGPEDEKALASYVERKWCFVTSRIAVEGTGLEAGLIDALVISFPAPEPIYPFALTAAGGAETDVLLYVSSDHKVAHPALGLLYDGMGALPWLAIWGDSGEVEEDEGGPEYGIRWTDSTAEKPILPRRLEHLTKLRGRLSLKNVRTDLVLGRAADDDPYRETIWRW